MTYEDDYKKLGINAQRKYPNEALLRFLAIHFPERTGSILEIGCGSGANLWMLAQEGFHTYGQDISETGIEVCRNMLASKGLIAELTVGDFEKLRYPDEHFDAIVDVVSLACVDIEGHERAIKEIHRCLKPGGWFFSWHHGNTSDSYMESEHDNFVVKNIRPPLPYAGNGLICFLDVEKAKELLRDFGNVAVDIYTQERGGHILEFLAIEAQKS